jgi:hypothetical protein
MRNDACPWTCCSARSVTDAPEAVIRTGTPPVSLADTTAGRGLRTPAMRYWVRSTVRVSPYRRSEMWIGISRGGAAFWTRMRICPWSLPDADTSSTAVLPGLTLLPARIWTREPLTGPRLSPLVACCHDAA